MRVPLRTFAWTVAAGTALAGVNVASVEQESAPPPYERRGDEVEATYTAFVDRLERYQARLREALERDAPDLAARLRPDPPAAVAYGYQLLPTLTPGKAAASHQRPRSISYSWQRTQNIIDAQVERLAGDEGTLNAAAEEAPAQRRDAYERLVDSYEILDGNQKIADQHLKHNRFWQPELARDPERFRRQTQLHDAAVERETVRSRLDDATLSAERRDEMRARVDALQRQIQDGQPRPALPDYVTLSTDPEGTHVVHVPIYTDISDAAFLNAAERAIEDAWRGSTRTGPYRIDVELRPRTVAELYAGEPPPARGAHIDVAAHAARFPTDGGVLTTGANRTHAIVGRFMALGPGAMWGNTVAHEFGHILGFSDRYLRGSRDRGDAGYEIIEIVPDPDDIMAAAGSGDVLPQHFEQLGLGAR